MLGIKEKQLAEGSAYSDMGPMGSMEIVVPASVITKILNVGNKNNTLLRGHDINNPNNALLQKTTPNDRTFALFDPFKMGNLMIPAHPCLPKTTWPTCHGLLFSTS